MHQELGYAVAGIVGVMVPVVGAILSVIPTLSIGMVENNNFAGKNEYKKVIERLRTKITELIPSKELWRGRLANWKLAKYLGISYGKKSDGRMWDTISTILKGERHITQEDFDVFQKSLDKFFGEKAKDCIKYVKDLINSDNFRKYPKQQWHLHNPELKADFFKGIANNIFDESNIVPSYWYGFMMSDASQQSGLFQQSEGSVKEHRYRYDISIELQERDRNFLEQFCDAIGLDSTKKVKERTVEKWGKNYPMVYVSFGCRDMIDDLNELGFTSSKETRRKIPDYVEKALELAFDNIDRKNIGPSHIAESIHGKIALVWLKGAYDGDGHSDRTELGSAYKQYLESIKKAFKIEYPVRPHPTKPNFWILSLGARLFNAMTSVCNEYDIGLERKNFHFSESREALNILKEKLEDLDTDSKKLQELVFQFRQYELVRMYSTTVETFGKLLDEWGIKLPPNGYWTSRNRYIGDWK